MKFSIKFILCSLLLCTISQQGFATAWTTVSAGAINTLSNWSDGSSAPTSFTTPGDTWTVNKSMTLPSSGTWTVGTASASAVTVTFATGGTLSMSGAGSTFTITIHGNLNMSGGTFSLGGAGTTANVTVNGSVDVATGTISSVASSTDLNMTVNGPFTMSGGSVATSGASSTVTWNTNGSFTMTGGSFVAGGAGADLLHNIKGNGSYSGTCSSTNTGAGCTNEIHFALPTASGVMSIDNTSTGTWSKTNVFVDAGCTAQLAGNFSTTTGTSAYGLTVNGTLICPAAFVVNGTRTFTLSSLATLVVAHPTGINGAIVTTGTTTFNNNANYTFNGTAPQLTGAYLPASLVSPSVMTINNSAGVTLSHSEATTGVLAFSSGILNTGTNTMTTPGTAGAVTGAGATSYVNGTLIKTIAGVTSINYEVGDVNYAPMALTLSPAGSGGSIGLKTTNGLHPNVATSGLTSANMANHYWTISTYSPTGPATITPKATYNAVDILGGSNASFVTQKYSGSAWLATSLTTTNASSPYTSTPTAGIALAGIAGQYIFGNLPCGTLPITGTPIVCVGATTTLADATPGGTWNSATTGIATVSSTGVVTGVSAGTAVISYTASGCTVSVVVTVTPAADAGTITGVTSACIGLTTSLSNATTGGTWSSSTPSVGTISSTGVVAGISAGTTVISYSVTNSCGTATTTVTVNVGTSLLVAPITGVDSVCPGRTDTLYCATGGGVWTSLTTTVAVVSATGVITGITPGYDTIVYTVTNSCGTASSKYRIKVRDSADCPLAINPIASNPEPTLQVFPNPNTGTFTVLLSAAETKTTHIVVTNVLGTKVRQTTSTTNAKQTIMLDQPPGIYYVSVTTENERYTAKVLIQ